MAWIYDAAKHQYVDGDRVLSHDELMAIRNAIADGMSEESATLAQKLIAKTITLAQWAKAFAQLLQDGIGAGFLLGRGGTEQMDDASAAVLDGLITDQLGYAKDFATAIDAALADDSATVDGVAARSALYSGAAVHGFDQGRAQDFEVNLPYYPADGQTVCGGNCFPFDTIVESLDLSGAYRRMFDGEVVTIQTATGHKLTATPNHPVLTARGWVAIGELTQADRLVSGQLGERVAFGQPDINNRPTEIGQVFDAARNVWSRQRVMGAVLDFHGDPSDGEVDVVLRGRNLTNERDHSFLEKLGERILAGPDGLRELEAFTRRLSFALIGGLAATANGIMSGSGQRASLLCAHPSHAQQVGFGSGTRRDAGLGQVVHDRATMNPKRLANRKHALTGLKPAHDVYRRQRRASRLLTTQFDAALFQATANGGALGPNAIRNAFDGFANEIAFHDVVDIQRYAYRGHVFNLQTGQGWYSANGLIVHNCRCEWQLVDTDTELTATWITVGDRKVCDDCQARGDEYGPGSPFVQTKGDA